MLKYCHCRAHNTDNYTLCCKKFAMKVVEIGDRRSFVCRKFVGGQNYGYTKWDEVEMPILVNFGIQRGGVQKSGSIYNGKRPKRPMNQNGPDQNGPRIFGMTKTAHGKTKTAHGHIQNGPPLSRKRPMTHRPRKLWKSGTVGARRGGWVWGRGLTPPQFLGSCCVTPGEIFENICAHLCNLVHFRTSGDQKWDGK